MPKIPTFNAPANVQGQITTRATAADFGSQIGAAAQNLGGGVAKLGAFLQEREDRKTATQIEEQFANDQLGVTEFLVNHAKNSTNNGDGAVEAVRAEIDRRREAAIAAAPNEQARQRVAVLYARLNTTGVRQGIRMQAGAAARGAIASVKATLDTHKKNVFLDGSQDAFDTALEGLTRSVALIKGIGTQRRTDLQRIGREDLFATRADGILSRVRSSGEAAAALTLLKTDEFKKGLSARAFQVAVTKAQRLFRQHGERDSVSALRDFKERARELSVIGGEAPTREEVNAALPGRQKKQEAVHKALVIAARIGNEFVAVQGMTPIEIAKRRKELVAARDKKGNFDEDRARLTAHDNAAVAHRNRIEKDSATYAIEIDQPTRVAAEAYAKDQTPVNFDKLADAQMSAQIRMGVSPRDVKLLSASMVAEIQEKLRGTASDAKGAIQSFQFIKSMATQFGNHYPLVHRQLQSAKVFSSTESVVAGMTLPTQAADAERLMVASKLTRKDFEASIADFKNVRSQVVEQTQVELAELFTTLNGVAGGASAFTRRSDAVVLLALANIRDNGDSVDAAVSAANEAIHGKAFDFAGTIRLPKSAGLSMGHVEQVTADTLAKLNFKDVLVPRSFIPGVTLEERRRQYEFIVKRQGRWRTNGNGTGLILTDPRGNSIQVGRKVIELSWDEIRNTTIEAVSPEGVFSETGIVN